MPSCDLIIAQLCDVKVLRPLVQDRKRKPVVLVVQRRSVRENQGDIPV